MVAGCRVAAGCRGLKDCSLVDSLDSHAEALDGSWQEDGCLETTIQ